MRFFLFDLLLGGDLGAVAAVHLVQGPLEAHALRRLLLT
jgi:hypothetical protein